MEEKLLIKKAKKGNNKAFMDLLRIYEKDMYLLAKYMVKDDELIKDAVQDTILKVYERIGYLKNEDSFKFWLLKILGNKCRDILKKDKNIIYLDVQIEEGYVDKGYDAIEIKNCIEKLNESQREIITLYYFNELTYKEISEIMNIPEGTVKSKLSRAKEYLRNIVGEEEMKLNEIRRNVK
jgi:RNA polymerase sigma-70 factor, ECF subfamily